MTNIAPNTSDTSAEDSLMYVKTDSIFNRCYKNNKLTYRLETGRQLCISL